MGYVLGVDLGTTFTAAAVRADGRTVVAQLGSQRPEIPSTVFVKPDGGVLVGDAAERRGRSDPARLAREFKRRVGDPTPIRLGETGYSAQTLMAFLLGGVLETVAGHQQGPPAHVGLTCPASWGSYRRKILQEAVALAGLNGVQLRTEPEAAAIQFARSERVRVGEVIAVYDLGGGTFDAAVLRKVDVGFEILGQPQGIDRLGGVDFDQAVLDHALRALGRAIADLDPEDPAVVQGLVRLRQECVDAKEALSYDIDVAIPVALPALHTQVRLTRAELEVLIAPALTETVEAMERALSSADVEPQALRAVVLAGGSARIPLVAERLTKRFGCPLVLDASPAHSVALGAALAADPALAAESAPGTGSPPVVAGRRTRAVPTPATGASSPGATTTPAGAPPPARTRPRRRAAVVGGVVAAAMAAGVFIWAAAAGRDPQQEAEPAASPDGTVAATAAWVGRADLPVALEGAAVTAFQDKVWVAGGLGNDEARTKLSTVFIYDPGSDEWSTGPSLPRPVSHGALVATPSTLYFLGGWLSDGFGSAQVLKLNSTNTAWVQDVPLPATRVAGAAAFDGRSVVYAGGTAKGGAAADTVWALHGARWVSIGRLSRKRQKLAAVSNNVDTIWLLGGRDQESGAKFGAIDRVSQGRVQAAPDGQQAPITPPVDSAAAVRLDGVGMCLVGGEVPGRSYNDWWCDEPGAAAKLPKLEPQRAGLGVARIGQTVYVVGGYGKTFQGTTQVEAYTPGGG